MSDLIDREEAIRAIVIEAVQKRLDVESVGTVIYILQNLSSARQWIPCSERLPEKDGQYLVIDNSGGAAWMNVSFYYKDGCPEWEYINVVAWMELPDMPEPWKGEEHG